MTANSKTTIFKFSVHYEWTVESPDPAELLQLATGICRQIPGMQNITNDSVTAISDSAGARALLSFAGNEEAAIERALALTGGNIVHTAEMLGCTRATLYAKMDKYGLKNPKTLLNP